MIRQTPHHTSLSDRISLAPAADRAWQPDATWREWCDYLFPATIATYRALRRSCQGREHFQSLHDLALSVGVALRALHPILDDLEQLGLVRLQRNRRGTINTIEVGDPPPVPEDIEEVLRHCAYNRPPPPSEADVRRWIDFWSAKYEQLRGVAYHVRPRDRPLVRSMLATYGLAKLKQIAWFTLVGTDVEEDVIRHDEISIGTFKARINALALAWRQHELRQRPVNTGTRKQQPVRRQPVVDPTILDRMRRR